MDQFNLAREHVPVRIYVESRFSVTTLLKCEITCSVKKFHLFQVTETIFQTFDSISLINISIEKYK